MCGRDFLTPPALSSSDVYMRAPSSPKRKQCGESEPTGLAKFPLPLIVGLGANSPFFPVLLYIVHSSSNLALKTL